MDSNVSSGNLEFEKKNVQIYWERNIIFEPKLSFIEEELPLHMFYEEYDKRN